VTLPVTNRQSIQALVTTVFESLMANSSSIILFISRVSKIAKRKINIKR